MREEQIKDLIRKKVRKLILENITVPSVYTSLVKGVHYTLDEIEDLTGFDEEHIQKLCDDHILFYNEPDDSYLLNIE